MNEYYVYAHLNPTNNEIFYIGKGKGNRKYNKSKRNEKWLEYVSKLSKPFKVLVIKDELSNQEALLLEKKILNKVDFHYNDLTTNIADSDPMYNGVGITFSFDLSDSIDSKDSNDEKKPRFEEFTDNEIIKSLLSFPNEKLFNKVEKSFELIYDSFYDNYDDLEAIDEDLFIDVQSMIDSIYDLIEEYKVEGKVSMDEFIEDLKRERVDVEFILEEELEDEFKQVANQLLYWINGFNN